MDSFRGLNQLGQHTARRGGMKERNPAVADPAPGLLVDQAQAARAALLEGLGDVDAPIRGVVKPGSSLGEKAPDRRVLAERLQQLDVRVAHAQKRRLDTLLRDCLAMLQRHPETIRVELDRRIEVFDGDPDVIDCLKHGEAV
jgi:hypothetical protein